MNKKDVVDATIVNNDNKIKAINTTFFNDGKKEALEIATALNTLINKGTNFDLSKRTENNKSTTRLCYVDQNNQKIVLEKKVYSGTTIVTSSVCESIDIENRRKTVAELRKEGKTQKEIADIVGVSQKTVSLDLKKIKSDNDK